tara:strand:- start:110 stop:1465 length:1356 start_codon:yes stop_codon:yes gene_type:complete
MKIINKYIFKELLTPFLFALIILLFVLITQTFVKHIDKFIGKGLSVSIMFKYILFNSGWIFSLAVPMATLVATMMAFGRLSSDNEITAIKASGISNSKLLKPTLLFGFLLVIIMIPFNLWILPEMNFNNGLLNREISTNRPDIQIQAHQKNELFGKTIYISEDNNGQFYDISIFDNNSNSNNNSIFAEKGNMKAFKDGILLNLFFGTLHSYNKNTNEYQKTSFDNYQLTIPFQESNMALGVLNRTDKQLSFFKLIEKIDNRKKEISNLNNKISHDSNKLDSLKTKEHILQKKINSLETKKQNSTYNDIYIEINKIKNQISNLIIKIKNNKVMIPITLKKINQTYVEIHKKIAIPFACLIFMLIGIPLGIISKNGKFTINIAISLTFIIIYWAFLNIGEFLADENKISPFIGIWSGNFFMGIFALYLFYISNKENNKFNIKLINLKSLIKNK